MECFSEFALTSSHTQLVYFELLPNHLEIAKKEYFKPKREHLIQHCDVANKQYKKIISRLQVEPQAHDVYHFFFATKKIIPYLYNNKV